MSSDAAEIVRDQTVKACSLTLGVSDRTVHVWIQKKGCPADVVVPEGRVKPRVRVCVDEVRDWAVRQGLLHLTPPSEAPPDEPVTSDTPATPDVAVAQDGSSNGGREPAPFEPGERLAPLSLPATGDSDLDQLIATLSGVSQLTTRSMAQLGNMPAGDVEGRSKESRTLKGLSQEMRSLLDAILKFQERQGLVITKDEAARAMREVCGAVTGELGGLLPHLAGAMADATAAHLETHGLESDRAALIRACERPARELVDRVRERLSSTLSSAASVGEAGAAA
ncbi:MAG: hypothetical protein AAGI53_01570 [Planctomycetota bacterium]